MNSCYSYGLWFRTVHSLFVKMNNYLPMLGTKEPQLICDVIKMYNMDLLDNE